MTSELIYLSGRDCAGAEQFRNQAIPIYWRGRPNFIDQQRVDYSARKGARAAAAAAEQRKSRS